MTMVRPAAMAGYFYPTAAPELSRTVRSLLAGSRRTADKRQVAKVLIVPHAGYTYSGAIAAAGFSQWVEDADTIRRIVLLGPAHRKLVRGLALPGYGVFETPLGAVDVDLDLVARLVDLPQVSVSREAHAPEHCLEVELPFLQTILGDFTVLPLLVSSLASNEVADVLEQVWGGEETRLVISSDLSHFLPYEDARRMDRATAEAILATTDLGDERACGAMAVNGLLELVRRRRMTGRVLDLRNSGDTGGDRNRVVGYGSFAFFEPA